MKFVTSLLLLLPLSVFAQTQTQLAAPGSGMSPADNFSEQQRTRPEPARPAEPARTAPQRPEPARPEPARPAPQPIHKPAPVHPAPGPAHHGPQTDHRHPGPNGQWTPHPGWHAGWHYDHTWHPSWFHVGLAFTPFVWLGDVPSGYWQCTAFNQQMQAFTEMGPDNDQAAYGALNDCGGANYEAVGCYIPDGYCQPR